jgi:hypothetical protein
MPKGPRGEKRPADVIGAAIMVAKIATGAPNFKLRQCLQPSQFCDGKAYVKPSLTYC